MAESFGAALLRLREAAGLSQRKLARAVPISQSALSRYEAGLQRPDDRTAARLDELLAARGWLLDLWPTLGTDTLSPAEEERRSEEHTSELQSRFDLVCRLLLEKKKVTTKL